MTESALSWAAFALYSAAAFAAFGYLLTKDHRASRVMLAMLGAGVLLHAGAFAARVAAFWTYPENRFYLPITSFFGAMSYMSLALAGSFLAIEARRRLGILGAVVLPSAALALGAALAFARPETGPLAMPLRSYWLNLHPVLLMTAYAAFANAFGVGLALLIQERQIKSRKPTELCYRLPSLDELEALNARIIAWSFPLLLAGLVMGFVWAYLDWGTIWVWDAKLALSLVTAGFYARYLWLRFAAGRRGRATVYVALAGFAFAMFTLFCAELVSGRHTYMGGAR